MQVTQNSARLACSIMQSVNQLLPQIGKFEFKFCACVRRKAGARRTYLPQQAVANTARSSYARQYFKSSLCLNFHKVPQQPLSARSHCQPAASQQLTPIHSSGTLFPTKPAAAKRIHTKVLRRALFLPLFATGH